jgi:hypothetical protein
MAAFAASPAMAGVLANWTFEVSIPTTAGPYAAEAGVFAATSMASGWHAGAAAYSNPVGNATLESYSATAWAVGDYWQFTTSSVGYNKIGLEWDQVSSNTGPRDFGLWYSTNGTTFTQFDGGYIVLANAAPPLPNPWQSGGPYVPQTHYAYDLSTVTALDNQATIYFRFIDASTVSANNNTVQSGGTDRVDNVFINENVPEPASLVLLVAGSLMLIRRR